MTDSQSLLEQLQEIIHWKKTKAFYAERFGITEDEVTNLLRILRGKENIIVDKKVFTEEIKKVNNEKGTIESTLVLDYEPKSDTELAKLHRVNLDSYVIANYFSKLLPNGKFTSTIFCKRKQAQDYTQEDFVNFLKDFVPNNLPSQTLCSPKNKTFVDIEISLSDYHLAKKHIDGDNSPSERALRYFNVAQDLVQKARSIYNLDTIIFPISNDFFHTDNIQNQTTNGTPQDTILNYNEEYELGFSILVDTINMLKFNCNNVKVVLVQGNHDRTKSFYLAHALEVFFKYNLDVTFDREHSVTKGMTVGNTFIGWHHGNCKIDELPLLFATDPKFSQQFGNAKYREIHTGDKHHYMTKDIKGVRIQQMPSLSGTDRWHNDNNFVHSIRAALALVYDPKLGKIAEFESRI